MIGGTAEKVERTRFGCRKAKHGIASCQYCIASCQRWLKVCSFYTSSLSSIIFLLFSCLFTCFYLCFYRKELANAQQELKVEHERKHGMDPEKKRKVKEEKKQMQDAINKLMEEKMELIKKHSYLEGVLQSRDKSGGGV